MRLIRENLFFVVLIGIVVVVGAGGLVWYFTSDLDDRLAKRQRLSTDLRTLAKRRKKVNATIIGKMKDRIDRGKMAVAKDGQDSIDLNRSILRPMELTIGGMKEAAFPVDMAQYDARGLFLVFIRQYHESIDKMLAAPELKRTTTPTEEELKREEALLLEKYKEQAKEQAVRSMMVKKARDGLVFINDDAMDRHLPLNATKTDAIQMWEAQVNLWVTQEVLRAISMTNQEVIAARLKAGVGSTAPSVLNSAVKRLEKLEITEKMASPVSARPGRPRAGRAAVSVAGAGKITGRVTGGDHIVVPYWFRVVLPSRHVSRLIRNLMLPNYHTVLKIEMSELVRKPNTLFYFGTEPVVVVHISAELLLLPDWVYPLMPQTLQDMLPAPKAAK